MRDGSRRIAPRPVMVIAAVRTPWIGRGTALGLSVKRLAERAGLEPTTGGSPQGDEPLIPMPALSLPALRQAVATVAPSRLPEFFQEIQDAFTQAGDEDSVFPIRHFYQRWGAAIAIERRPSVAARLHAAERALADPDPAVRDQAVREAAEIVQAAYREVAGG